MLGSRLKLKRTGREWKQALTLTVWREGGANFRVDLPVEIGTDEDGRFVVIPVHNAHFNLDGADLSLEVKMKFSDRESRETLRAVVSRRSGERPVGSHRPLTSEGGLAL